MRIVTCSAVALLTTTGVVLAQQSGTVTTTAISVSDLLAPWLPILMTAFMGIVLAILEVIRQWIKKKTGVEIETSHMLVLQKAIENGAGLALNKLKNHAKTISIDTRSDAVRQGVEYVNQAAADAVNNFGLTSEQLAEKIIAKMGVITAPNPEMNIQDVTPPPPNTGSGG